MRRNGINTFVPSTLYRHIQIFCLVNTASLNYYYFFPLLKNSNRKTSSCQLWAKVVVCGASLWELSIDSVQWVGRRIEWRERLWTDKWKPGFFTHTFFNKAWSLFTWHSCTASANCSKVTRLELNSVNVRRLNCVKSKSCHVSCNAELTTVLLWVRTAYFQHRNTLLAFIMWISEIFRATNIKNKVY